MTDLLVILGPTASGKTGLAVAAARAFGGEILSADSRQFYRGMDLGTGKDLHEFTTGGTPVEHHLIDIAEPDAPLNIHDFFGKYQTALHDVISRGKLPILCGGSGLYLETALGRNPLAAVPVNLALREALQSMNRSELERRFQALPAELQARLDDSTNKRMIRAIEVGEYLENHPEPTAALPATRPVFVGIDIPRDKRRARITQRLHERLKSGMIEEVERLLNQGISADQLRYFGLEYQCIVDYLKGATDLEAMTARLETDIHRFAKRQMTWFRRMEKRGDHIVWVDWDLAQADQLAEISAQLTTASRNPE